MYALFVAPVPLPKNWDPMPPGQQLLLVDIPMGSKEFAEVEKNIKTAPRDTIKEVLKVTRLSCTKTYDIILDRRVFVFGRPFVKRFALCYRTVVLSVCLYILSVCDVGVLWPNGWMDQDETWHAGRPRYWPHCTRWGPTSPSQMGQPPNFRPRPYLLWRNG